MTSHLVFYPVAISGDYATWYALGWCLIGFSTSFRYTISAGC